MRGIEKAGQRGIFILIYKLLDFVKKKYLFLGIEILCYLSDICIGPPYLFSMGSGFLGGCSMGWWFLVGPLDYR